MNRFRAILVLVATIIGQPVAAIQTAGTYTISENFELYDIGPKSLFLCPGDAGPGNAGIDCGFGRLEGGSIMAATAQFPAASGSQVYAGTSIGLAVFNPSNTSWPAVYARVTSGDTPVTMRTYYHDPALNQEVLEHIFTLPAGMTNVWFGHGDIDDAMLLTRFTYESSSVFAIDDLKLGIERFEPGLPEPATWMMLILGFGAVGGVLRQRRRQLA